MNGYMIELYYLGKMVERSELLTEREAAGRYRKLLKAGGYGVLLYENGRRMKSGEAFRKMDVQFGRTMPVLSGALGTGMTEVFR